MDLLGASLEVVLLTLAAGTAALCAAWLSHLRTRRVRRLVDWLREHRPERWNELPWLSRTFNVIGSIEQVRRGRLSGDPHFMALYRDAKRGGRARVITILLAMALIGGILLGVRYLGWSWRETSSWPLST